MRVKYIDESRNLREKKRIRETIRDWIRKRIGRRKYNKLIEKIGASMEQRKKELKEKYSRKTEHIKKLRDKEIIEKLVNVPIGLEDFSGCKIFNKREMEEMEPEKVDIKVIGKVKLDEDELSILSLNPKFAILRKLETIEIEQDIEISLAKMRYEITRIEAHKENN